MDLSSQKIFEKIKAKHKEDGLIWTKIQEDEDNQLEWEKEDEFIERMFLIFYVEQYLDIKNKIVTLEKENKELREELIRRIN